MTGRDRLSKERRSWNMAQIKGKNTRPERVVRSLLHRMGYRFRLHAKGLPGKPDIILPKHRAVIFVHGCFWHLHAGCRLAELPMTRRSWWRAKLRGNAVRDRKVRRALKRDGWKVVVVWGCEIRDLEGVASRVVAALPGGSGKNLVPRDRLRQDGAEHE